MGKRGRDSIGTKKIYKQGRYTIDDTNTAEECTKEWSMQYLADGAFDNSLSNRCGVASTQSTGGKLKQGKSSCWYLDHLDRVRSS